MLDGIILREAQEQAIMPAVLGLRNDGRALVVLASGLGKSLAGAFIAKEFKPRKTLFLVDKNHPLGHAMSEFQKVFDPAVTKMAFYNGLFDKKKAFEADIVFSTWQTMGDKLEKWDPDHFDLIEVDESHHSMADTYEPTLDYFSGAKLGMTATPDRTDERDIREKFGEPVVNIPMEKAIALGWLPRIEYHVLTDTTIDKDVLAQIVKEIRVDHKRITMAEINRRLFIKKQSREMARIINENPSKAVVFCNSIDHAERMAKMLQKTAPFHSSVGKNHRITWDLNNLTLQKLRKGELTRVTAVNAFNEGVDVPDISLVVFCRLTESMTVFRQQLGRGLRPEKDVLVVYDFAANADRIRRIQEMANAIADHYEQCTSAAQRTHAGYVRERFEVSGKDFNFTFSDEVVDIIEILELCNRDFYPTLEEASSAAKALELQTVDVYRERYKEDPRLPSNPDCIYKNFPGWPMFLRGEEPKEFYPTWEEASEAAQALGIKTVIEYEKRYKEDPRLPSSPSQTYKEDFPGYPMFLRGQSVDFYPTLEEASEAARALGIRTCAEYKVRYKEDSRLHSRPMDLYENFPKWRMFLRGEEPKEFYPTWEEASKAAQALEIRTGEEYKARYKEDLRLPGAPGTFYENFPGYPMFLRGQAIDFYPTWEEASEAAQTLGLSTTEKYKKGRKEDPRLPSNPNAFYEDFPGYPTFLRGEKPKNFYPTWEEASEAAQALGIKTSIEYKSRRKEDPRLPGAPFTFYKNFPGYPMFFGKTKK